MRIRQKELRVRRKRKTELQAEARRTSGTTVAPKVANRPTPVRPNPRPQARDNRPAGGDRGPRDNRGPRDDNRGPRPGGDNRGPRPGGDDRGPRSENREPRGDRPPRTDNRPPREERPAAAPVVASTETPAVETEGDVAPASE